MDHTYWHKQTKDQPLFPDMVWSRPENKTFAGKLLIVGGGSHGFAAPADAYSVSQKAGVGVARVLLPDVLQKTVGKIFEAGEFAPSNPSGGFAQLGLGGLLAMSEWSDGVLLAGDFGRNSETAILLEKFVEKYDGQLTLTKDAVDYFMITPGPLLGRSGNTTLVLSFSQLQKFATSAHFSKAFTFDIDMVRLVDSLHEFSTQFGINIITKHFDTIFVAVQGEVSTTKLSTDIAIWRVRVAAQASVWWLQNPSQAYKALTIAVIGIEKPSSGR
jgi:hypothetical protein